MILGKQVKIFVCFPIPTPLTLCFCIKNNKKNTGERLRPLIYPGTNSRQLRTGPTLQSLMKLLQPTNPNLLSLLIASSISFQEITIKAMVYIFPLLPLQCDKPWYFFMWPCKMHHASWLQKTVNKNFFLHNPDFCVCVSHHAW